MPPRKRTPPARKPSAPKPPGTTASPGWYKLAIVGGAGLVALAVIVVAAAWISGGGGSGGSPASTLAAAGCTFKSYPDQGQQHVQSLDAKVPYNSVPATSGSHYFQPAVWGAYGDPLSEVQVVHNLEHGGVIIQYGNKVEPPTRDALRSFYDASPNGMLLAPLVKLGDKIALTAWTRLATCSVFDASAFEAFRTAYRGNGPERFRIGDLAPGS